MRNKFDFSKFSDEELSNIYCNNEYSLEKLAKILGTSRETIRKEPIRRKIDYNKLKEDCRSESKNNSSNLL